MTRQPTAVSSYVTEEIPAQWEPSIYAAAQRYRFPPLPNGELPPPFASVDDERVYRRQRLAIALRIFGLFGFDVGLAGHVTVRDPADPEHFWVNPLGVSFRHIRVSDLLLISASGERLRGKGYLNEAAFAIHAALHRARPDVMAAAHAHAPFGRTWSTMGRLLDPITQDSAAFYQKHSLYSTFGGVVLDDDEGDRIASALGDHRALILQNHGFLTVGQTIESATCRFISMEHAAQTQLWAEAAGGAKLLPEAIALHTSNQVGSDYGMWLSFHPLMDRVLHEDPDVLDVT